MNQTWAARPLYDPAQLRPLVRPQSIAVVGASVDPAKAGSRVLTELDKAGYVGARFAVSTKVRPGSSLHGATVVSSISELPEAVDCVVVGIPAADVERVVGDIAERGCRSAIVFSSGYGEVSDGGRQNEQRLAEIARDSGVVLSGPNSAGIINYRDRIPLTFISDLHMDLPSGNMAVVAQSGGFATHLAHCRNRGARFSYAMTAGNSVDVNALDYAGFMIDDDATEVVMLVLEGIKNARALIELGARSRAVGKPVLILKVGRSEEGRRAALSHTGSLAGSYEVFEAAAREAGLQTFDDLEELLETASLFAKWHGRPVSLTDSVAVVATMGGPAVLAADAASKVGLDLPEPSAAALERIRKVTPAFAAVQNPVDVTASFGGVDALEEALVALADDEQYAAVVSVFATTTGETTAKRPHVHNLATERARAPIAAVWISSWREGPGSEILDESPTVPIFRSAQRCFAAIRRWLDWHRVDLVERASVREDSIDPVELRRVLQELKGISSGLLSLDEADSRRVLSHIGIDSAKARVVATAEEIGDAASAIGFPVVVKAVCADLPHKKAADAVRLNVASAEDAIAAGKDIAASVQVFRPGLVLDGFLVSEMVRADHEFMCGLINDNTFGPTVVCAAGGSDVELIRDAARCLAPTTVASARRAVRTLSIVQRIEREDPSRAEQVVEAIAFTMCAVGDLAGFPEVAEVDVNPIVVDERGAIIALDALVVLADALGDLAGRDE